MEIDMLIEMFERMFIVPVVITLLNIVFRVVKDLMQGNGWEVLKTNEETKEEIKEEKKKINIDKDLQKYFNYKE